MYTAVLLISCNVFEGEKVLMISITLDGNTLIQGRGNKSSGDNFHAAPNIDHSQDFVRKDIKEWLCWMRLALLYCLYSLISADWFGV